MLLCDAHQHKEADHTHWGMQKEMTDDKEARKWFCCTSTGVLDGQQANEHLQLAGFLQSCQEGTFTRDPPPPDFFVFLFFF